MSALLKSLGANSWGIENISRADVKFAASLLFSVYLLKKCIATIKNTNFQQQWVVRGSLSRSGCSKLNAKHWWVMAAGYEMKVFTWHLTKCHMSAWLLLRDMKYVNISPWLLHFVILAKIRRRTRRCYYFPAAYRTWSGSVVLMMTAKHVHRFNYFPKIVTLRQSQEPSDRLRWRAGPPRPSA